MYQIGDYVDFALPGSDGESHSTKDYKGKVIVLYTYPRDNTPGCTIEANTFKELMPEFHKLNAVILGLNNNSLKSHDNFKTKYCLPFVLLTDENLEVVSGLDAKKEEHKVFRKTFILDEEGRLEKRYDSVSPKTHPAEVLDYLKTRQ